MTSTIATQTEEQLGGPGSLFVRQRRDHIRLDQLLHELRDARGRRRQDEVLQAIARLVFPHAFAEESVIWPLARRVLPDGEELTLRIEQEHQQINELWTRLERGDGDRAALLAQLVALLQEDVRDEEDALFPRMQEELDAAQLRKAGRAWELVRRTAPTRPHPVVARRPPGNVAAALPMTVIDRTRDRLDRAARGGPARLRRPARTASGALASVVGRLEHVPPMNRGDDRSTHRD